MPTKIEGLPEKPDVQRSRRNAGLEMALTVGPTFGGLMFLGWVVGTKLDEMWGTAPTALCLCVLFATISGFIHLIRTARRLE